MNLNNLKIAVAGTRYVGLSIATLLSQVQVQCGFVELSYR